MLNFFSRHEIICEQQSGFMKNYSTNLSIAKLLKKIVGGMDAKNIGLYVFLDLQKAFDLVYHSVLLRKLNYCGIRGNSNNLSGSFLADNDQYVCLNNTSSTVRSVHLGVPQGSILSPLLFIIFINNIGNSSSILYFNLLADDISLYLDSSNINI